ncbi:hypothetical protein PSTG_09245 [Puccinia striiformis f. sp. tritici PST-78]|uniref:Uncharacterized protein n=1 Tax=Puccinia striiformis f. sp. tritici PST-78 TaxID=1165861 RepID=A0A0L0VE50_9BASI|nr:hypothetical protein PSTG_09245 [Puccinia striiformis f. sp. tritici PST-78]
MLLPTTIAEPTPKTKFLQQPSVYKQDVEALLADGSNFNRWKRGLTRVIHLCLGLENFFDNSTNYTKLSKQEQTCLLFLIQITVHNELASLVDCFPTGTEAYDAVQTNFQGSVCFCQIELINKLLEFKITGPATKPNQMAGLFNRIFEVFADLQKVGAGLSPTVESLVLQAICPTPTSMSQSQLFQNISLQLGARMAKVYVSTEHQPQTFPFSGPGPINLNPIRYHGAHRLLPVHEDLLAPIQFDPLNATLSTNNNIPGPIQIPTDNRTLADPGIQQLTTLLRRSTTSAKATPLLTTQIFSSASLACIVKDKAIGGVSAQFSAALPNESPTGLGQGAVW